MSNLLLWMEDEMTAHLRSGAAIRKTGALSCSSVHTVGSNGHIEEKKSSITDKPDDRKSKPNICYVCKGDHYVDKCSRFLAMVPGERWKVVKERGCFLCLKRSKSHTLFNCECRKACEKKCPDGRRQWCVEDLITSFFMKNKDQMLWTLLYSTIAARPFSP